MPSPLRVTCAIIIHQGKIFAARRGASSSHPFRWEFPGGKLEIGETEKQCIIRELYEELDMKAEILERLPSFFHQYPGFQIELIPFVCRLESTHHLPGEHDKTGWFCPDELPSLNWADADVAVMQYVVDNIIGRYT